jgi:predicted transcriptional regulator
VQKEVVSVRFTPEMLEKLAEVASQSNMSRNQVIESVVCEYVQNMEYLQAVREHQAGNSESEGAVETAPAPDTEVLEMTEREELGLGQECRDPIGEDGMQATDCDDGEDPAESPETAAPAESTEGDGDSPAEQETAETGEAEGE